MDHEQASALFVDLVVSPWWRRRGVGGALLAREVEQAKALGAVTLQARADDGWGDALAFLRAHGFVETMRMHRQVLDLAAATLDRLAGLESRLAGEGVGITTLARELAQEPLCWTKFRDVHQAAGECWAACMAPGWIPTTGPWHRDRAQGALGRRRPRPRRAHSDHLQRQPLR